MNNPAQQQLAESILSAAGPQGDASEALVAADYFLEREEPRLACSALDRAYGLEPHNSDIAAQRTALLDTMQIQEHGLTWRYIPAGSFLMGSDSGDDDEQPIHTMRLGDYWLTDTPITWAAYSDLMGWGEPPMKSWPAEAANDDARFLLAQENKIRSQYCETETEQAGDWHAHVPGQTYTRGDDDTPITTEELFGAVDRAHPKRPWGYDQKPIVSIGWQAAQALGERLTSDDILIELPIEPEWEKGARGGLIGQPYPWGDEPPSPQRCDFGHFGDWVIRPSRMFPANGYGLYGVSGGVWEWTQTIYDRLAYQQNAESFPNSNNLPRVLRGGSWSDCAAAVTVSFRSARGSMTSFDDPRDFGTQATPNIGFRLLRREKSASTSMQQA